MCTVLYCTWLYPTVLYCTKSQLATLLDHYLLDENTIYTQFCTVQYNTVQYIIMQKKIKSNLLKEQASDLNTIIFFHKSSLKYVYLNFDCPSGCGNLGNSFLQLQPIGRKIALPHSSNPNLPLSDTCPSTLFLTQGSQTHYSQIFLELQIRRCSSGMFNSPSTDNYPYSLSSTYISLNCSARLIQINWIFAGFFSHCRYASDKYHEPNILF